MKKIKLLHIQLLPLLSGVQNMMISLLSGLDQAKYDIYIISKGDGPLVEKVKENGWTHIAVKDWDRNISLKDMLVAFHIYNILKKIKPDIVHTHSSKPGFIGRIVAQKAKIPLVIHTIHGFPFHPYQNRAISFFYQKLESYAANYAHHNVFVNNFEREYAIQKLGFEPEKSITIYNAVQNMNIQKKEYNLHERLEIVSVLRFWKQKNIVFTMKKAIEVVKKHKNVFFTFYGDGELLPECKKLITKSGESDNIQLKGWCENILFLLPKYDVFLLNSLWEGLSISILEAMSVGLPIICSKIKGNTELVDSSNGWLINPLSDKELKQCIEQIITNKSILEEKGKDSIKKVTKLFRYELFIQSYKDLYENSKKQ